MRHKRDKENRERKEKNVRRQSHPRKITYRHHANGRRKNNGTKADQFTLDEKQPGNRYESIATRVRPEAVLPNPRDAGGQRGSNTVQ